MRQLLWIFLFLPLLTGCYLVKQSGQFYGLDTMGKNVVFVVDISGSMEDKQEGSLSTQLSSVAIHKGAGLVSDAIGGPLGSMVSGQLYAEGTKLGAAKRELMPAIRGLAPTSKFTIITFGDKIVEWHSELVEASGIEKNLSTIYVKALSANGGTPAMAALNDGFRFKDAGMIFFLSDGQPTDASAAQILEAVQHLNSDKRMIIHTIGLGPDQDVDFLSRLAQENGGTYVARK